MIEALTGWLLNYLLHSTVLLGGVWALERAGWLKHPAWREAFWRAAFFGAVLTASVQPLTQVTRIALPDAWLSTSGAALASASEAQTPPALPADAMSADPMPAGETAGDADRPHAVASVSDRPVIVEDDALMPRRAVLQDMLAALLLAWPLVALLGLGLTLVRWLALRREVRALPQSEDHELRQAAAELAHQAGVQVPTLRVSATWASPLVAPGGQICLPDALMRRLEGQQRVAVLAHEIAHLRRRDLAWRLAARWVSQLGWLQPMNRLAMRRLDLLAELACDRWAAVEAGAMPLAESLYVCARDSAPAARGSRPMPVLASAMAATRSPLMTRMHALLEESPMSESTPVRRRLGRLALASGLCVLAPAVPMLVIGKAPTINFDLGSVGSAVSSVLGTGKVTRIVSITDDHDRRVRFDGDIVFNAEETDIVSLDRKLEISETLHGVTRRAEIVSDGKGGTVRRYWIDDDAHALDDAGQEWLSGQIALLAESTQGSDARTRRLQARGGVAAVLADIEKPSDPFVRKSRLDALLATGPQDDATLSRLIAIAGRLADGFQRRSALQAIVEHRALSPALQREVLAAVHQVDGDFERRQVLEAITPQLVRDDAVLGAWQQAVKEIGGDFERRSVIVTLIEQQDQVDRAVALNVLGAMDGLDGEFERAQVLVALAERMPVDPELIARYRQAARGLGTHERGRVEQALDHLTPS